MIRKTTDIIVRLILYSLIALMPLACGTRKAHTNTSKSSESNKEKESSETSISKKSESLESVKLKEQLDKLSKSQEYRIIETFNEAGNLVQRITENIHSESSDKSIKESESNTKMLSNSDSLSKTNKSLESKKEDQKKAKKTETNNVPIYLWLACLLVCCILAFRWYSKLNSKV